MDLPTLVTFSAAIFVAAIVPGPAVAAIVARVLGRGPADAAALASGIVLGSMIWLVFVVAGLATIAQTFGTLFLAIRYVGALYLLVLACRLWNARPDAVSTASPSEADRPARLFLGGMALELGNPKTMVFYLALVPTIVDLHHVSSAMFAALLLAVLIVVGSVFAGYVVLAARSRPLFRNARALKAMNRTAGAALAGAACAVAVRSQ